MRDYRGFARETIDKNLFARENTEEVQPGIVGYGKILQMRQLFSYLSWDFSQLNLKRIPWFLGFS